MLKVHLFFKELNNILELAEVGILSFQTIALYKSLLYGGVLNTLQWLERCK